MLLFKNGIKKLLKYKIKTYKNYYSLKKYLLITLQNIISKKNLRRYDEN